MIQQEKIKFLKLALSMQNLGLSMLQLDKMITTYEMICERKGNLTIQQIIELEAIVENRHKVSQKDL